MADVDAPVDAPRLRVIVVDDDPLARRVIRDALQKAGIAVPAEAGEGREAVELALHYKPDIVLMDVVMPGMDGVEAMRRIVERAPEVRVVMLTMAAHEDVGVLALRTGASGFLSKDTGVEALPRALGQASAGEIVCSRAFISELVAQLRSLPTDGSGMRPVRSPLTSREWEVVDLLCQARSTDEIAAELFLSTETVRSHVKNVMRKLGVHSREEVVAAALRLRQPSASQPAA